MVASRQVEIPFFRGIGRQRGLRRGALAQIIGRTAISFLRKYFLPAAKSVGADLLEIAAPEIADEVSGRRSFNTAAKCVGRHTQRKQLGSGSRKRSASRVIPGGCEKTFLQTFLNNHVGQSSMPTFCSSSWKIWGKVPVVVDVLLS